MNVLIIEDEAPASRRLQNQLKLCRPDWVVLKITDSIESTVNFFKSTTIHPDLILCDIQLGDGLSFSIFQQIIISCPVIFTTAFDQYALQAFKVNSVDYLLKPINPEELEAAISKFEQLAKPPPDSAILMKLLETMSPQQKVKERFLVKAGNHFITIPTSDIAYFYSDSGVTEILLFNGKRYIIDHSLDEIEKSVSQKCFYRISRNVILHIETIQKISPYFSGRLILELKPDSPFEATVSRERVSGFRAWLEQ